MPTVRIRPKRVLKDGKKEEIQYELVLPHPAAPTAYLECQSLEVVFANILLFFEARHPDGKDKRYGEVFIKRGVRQGSEEKVVASSKVIASSKLGKEIAIKELAAEIADEELAGVKGNEKLAETIGEMIKENWLDKNNEKGSENSEKDADSTPRGASG